MSGSPLESLFSLSLTQARPKIVAQMMATPPRTPPAIVPALGDFAVREVGAGCTFVDVLAMVRRELLIVY
jgi:hypothetical protein